MTSSVERDRLVSVGGSSPQPSSVGQVIAARRRERGLSLEEVARKAGLSVNTIRNVEASRIGRRSTLLLICKVLGLDADHLPPPPPSLRSPLVPLVRAAAALPGKTQIVIDLGTSEALFQALLKIDATHKLQVYGAGVHAKGVAAREIAEQTWGKRVLIRASRPVRPAAREEAALLTPESPSLVSQVILPGKPRPAPKDKIEGKGVAHA